MNIHQLSVTYQIDQDRILVQFNTQAGEVLRLWLTRRLVINLFPRLTQVATSVEVNNVQLTSQDDTAKKILMEFKRQESITQGDFKTPFNEQASAFPLGPEPLLVTTINLQPTGNGVLSIRFEEKIPGPDTPRGFQVTMASSLLHNFMHLLESSIKASEWGILPYGQNASPEQAAASEPKPAEPPQYLN